MNERKKRTAVKLILIIFFLIFFIFLFWYFYKPSDSRTFGEKIKSDFNLFPFKDLVISNKEQNTKKNNNNKNKEEKNNNNKEEKIPRLRQISKKPTAGVYFDLLNKEEIKKINKKRDIKKKILDKDFVSEIVYILSKNNHVYRTYTDTLKENRVSNITIPKIQEVLFFDKDNFIVRYLNKNTIKTYSIFLSEKSEEELAIEKEQNKDILVDENLKKFNGLFLPNNILEITKSPNNSDIFYLYKKNGEYIGVKSNKLGDNPKKIKKFDFFEWNINWVDSNKILFTSKPSKETHSIAMELNLNNGSFIKKSKSLLAGNSLPNRDYSKILFSGINGENIFLMIWDKDKDSRKITRISTVVDKCVWSKNNIDVYCAVPIRGLDKNQPDSWYRGYNYFNDRIFKINTNTLKSELIYSNRGNDPHFDMVNIALDATERYIYWIDKKTRFAWSWQIKEDLSDDLKELEELEKQLNEIDKKTGKKLGAGKKCSTEQIITQNMQAGDRNGKYSSWQKGTITEVKKLQAHMNRLGFSAGAEDGILGPNTDEAIKRMQKFLGTYQDGKVGPLTRELINNSCE